MSADFGLGGKMISRLVKRWFDQRAERRSSVAGARAKLQWRGRSLEVEVANLSASGAMVICGEVPHVGEPVALTLADRRSARATVSWVRSGQMGIHFATPLE